MQQQTPLVLSSLINLYDSRSDIASDYFNTCLSLLILGYTGLALIFAFTAIKRYGQNEVVEELFQGVSVRTLIGQFWRPLQLLRWSLICLILVVWRDMAGMQIIGLLFLSIIFTILAMVGKPLEIKAENQMYLLNELLVSLYLYLLLCLTDLNIDQVSREAIGSLLIATLFLNISAGIAKAITKIITLLRHKFVIKKAKKVPLKENIPKKAIVRRKRKKNLQREVNVDDFIGWKDVEVIDANQQQATFAEREKVQRELLKGAKRTKHQSNFEYSIDQQMEYIFCKETATSIKSQKYALPQDIVDIGQNYKKSILTSEGRRRVRLGLL
ncbi:hypothetical protein FGO68_gene6936 [Halteria grandinella]|uniref:Uncharacterized protein n=1 Tax=Halteria grandinella TaxID=5974 RepID=A0A8J8TA07_HALGN|nr:hypothetical protein FGO68_gene6936 [Halteria grandinella]